MSNKLSIYQQTNIRKTNIKKGNNPLFEYVYAMPDCIAARKQLSYIYGFHVSQQTIRRLPRR